MDNHQILILGWPVSPVQKWLKNYPNIRVERIYREGTRKFEKYQKIFLSMYRNVYIQDG